jgi:hypothetical protein
MQPMRRLGGAKLFSLGGGGTGGFLLGFVPNVFPSGSLIVPQIPTFL